jgi:hypothetical protein
MSGSGGRLFGPTVSALCSRPRTVECKTLVQVVAGVNVAIIEFNTSTIATNGGLLGVAENRLQQL